MRTVLLLIIATSFIIYSSCTSQKRVNNSVESVKKEVTVTYEKQIKPLMDFHCTPCHYPERGKAKMLNDFTSVSRNIDDILSRIQLPKDDPKFMPYKMKKEPLSDSLITLFKTWKKEGTPER